MTGPNNHGGIEFHRKRPAISYPFRMTFFEVCYLKSLGMLEDKKLRAQACEEFASGKFFTDILNTFKKNVIEYDNCITNYTAPYQVLNTWQRVRFVIAIILIYVFYFALYPKYRKRKKRFLENLEKESKK